MNKLSIFKDNLKSSYFLSSVIVFFLTFTLIILPLCYYQSVEHVVDVTIDIYNEKTADYCIISFDDYFTDIENTTYKELSKTFDMENFAGIVNYGWYSVTNEVGNVFTYSYNFVSEALVKNMPPLDFKFSAKMPKDYREAYVPKGLGESYEIGKIYEISVYQGIYQYKQKIKVIGYSGNIYYDFNRGKNMITDMYHGTFSNSFMIYDNIPPYAKVNENGLMINDKTADYYKNLGASARSLRDLNESYQKTDVNDVFMYWMAAILFLFAVVIISNYYFMADKLIKRSGIMYIYGGKRSTIIAIEIIKMLLIFVFSFILSTTVMGIIISTAYMDNGIFIDWPTYLISASIIFGIYILCISFGFIKFAKFKPLNSISNNNLE